MTIIISIITFLFPLFFFPLISNPVFGAKNFFLAAAVVLILIFSGIKLVQKKKLTYSFAPLDIFVFLFLAANFVSWYFLPAGGRARSILQPTGLGSAVVLTFLYFIFSHIEIKNKIQTFLVPLAASGVILSIASIVLFILPEGFTAGWVGYLNFLTMANPLVLVQFLVLVGVLVVSQIIKEISREEEIKQWWMAIVAFILFVGIGISLYRTIQFQPILLDWYSSWATTVEAFKQRPIFGIGPQNFNIAFNRFRPREFNQTPHWNIRFGDSHSWFLQIWAELGIVGLIVLGLLLIRSLSLARKKTSLIYYLILTWATLFIFPGNLVTLFLLFLGLALVRGKGSQKSLKLAIGEKDQNGAPIIAGSLFIIFGLLIGYFAYGQFMPEMTFYRAVEAIAENRGADAYDLQVRAITQNPLVSSYRLSFSQLNMAFATNIVLQVQEQGQQLTEEEGQQLQQLIGQAVDEARAAVALEPQNVIGWENLAQIYRQLIGLVENADQWAITSYQQAISLDSINPRLRVDYGGLLYAFGQFEEAARQFEIAVNLKPDYANAWYNWAYALREQNKLQQAVSSLQQAVSLVDPATVDYQQVSAELEEWRADLDEEEVPVEVEEPTEEITRPEPLPEPQLDEPIVLPDDAAPPLDEEIVEEEISPPEEEELETEE